MSGDDSVGAYVGQIKQGWTQLSSGVIDQAKKYTGTATDEGANILPTNLMSMSSDEPTSTPGNTEEGAPPQTKAEQPPMRTQNDFADDPLGLRSEASEPKGKRITEANTEYVEKVAAAQKLATGGAEASGDDPLGLGK